MLEIDVHNETWYEIKSSLLKQFQDVLVAEGFVDEEASISLACVDNSTMQALNKEYSGIDAPTDVLSFPEQDLDDFMAQNLQSGALLGEIVIAVDIMKEQAPKYDNSVDEEFCRLFTHGVLHLIGYDHQDDEQKKEMQSKEDYILNKITC